MTEFRLPRIEIDRINKEIRLDRIATPEERKELGVGEFEDAWVRVATLDARWIDDTLDARFNEGDITSLNLTIFAENIAIFGDWSYSEPPRVHVTKSETAKDPDRHGGNGYNRY